MKIRRFHLFVLLCVIFFVQQQLLAQNSLTERSAAGYMGDVSEHAVLFTGRRPQPLSFQAQNHQFFKEKEHVGGRLSFGGVVYPNVLLRWDLYRDELALLTPGNNEIVLNSDHVGFAEMYGYRIIYLQADNLAGCPPAGYYIRLHSGKYLLYEKLVNNLFREMGAKRYLVNKFKLSTTFYLQKNEAYHKINNRRTLLKSLDTHHAELKQFIRANGLKYKHDAEKMVLEVVIQHEKLSQL